MYRRSMLLLVLIALVAVGCATTGVVDSKLDPARPQGSNAEVFKTQGGSVVVHGAPAPPLPQQDIADEPLPEYAVLPQVAQTFVNIASPVFAPVVVLTDTDNVVEVTYVTETPVATTPASVAPASTKPPVSMRPYKRSHTTTQVLATKPAQQSVELASSKPDPIHLSETEATKVQPSLPSDAIQEIKRLGGAVSMSDSLMNDLVGQSAAINHRLDRIENRLDQINHPQPWYQRFGAAFIAGLIVGLVVGAVVMGVYNARRLKVLFGRAKRQFKSFREHAAHRYAQRITSRDARIALQVEQIAERDAALRLLREELALETAAKLKLEGSPGIVQSSTEKPVSDEPPLSLMFRSELALLAGLPPQEWKLRYWAMHPEYTPEQVEREERMARELYNKNVGASPPSDIDQTREMTPAEVSGVITEPPKPHPLLPIEAEVGEQKPGVLIMSSKEAEEASLRTEQPRDERGRFAPMAVATGPGVN